MFLENCRLGGYIPKITQCCDAILTVPRSYGFLSKDWTPLLSDLRVELMRQHGLLPT